MSEQKRSLMPLLFTLAVLLIVGAAILYSSNPQLSSFARRTNAKQNPSLSLDQLKAQEFLGDEFVESAPIPAYAQSDKPTIRTPHFNVPRPNKTQVQGSNFAREELLPQESYLPSAAGGTYAPKAARLQTENSNTFTNQYTANAALVHQADRLAGRGENQTADATDNKEPSDIFSPYMAALTKKEAENLHKRLAGIPGAIQAAIARALLPKSKKDMNIEKYLARNSSSEKPASPLASVEQQFANQKANLVKSMKQNFGSKAANQAGQIMDAYQREMMDALQNQNNLTPEQLQQKTNAISNKYNKKLQQLSEKSGIEKLKQDHEKKDTVFQQNLAQSYGSDMAGQLGDILAKYREKELQLVQQPNLTTAQYYEQALANERAKRKEMEDALLAKGQSLQGLYRAENEEEKAFIDQLKQEEETGNVLPQVYKPGAEEIEARQLDRQKEHDDFRRRAQSAYGDEGVAVVDAIYNKYDQQVNAITNDPDTSYLEKREQLEQARQEANAQLSGQLGKLREDKQVDTALNQIMQDPSLANATPQQRAEFEQQARPLLHEMFARINEVNDNPDLSAQEKEQKIKAIQQDIQQQLARQ